MKSFQDFAKAVSAIEEMDRPIAGVFNVLSLGLGDLGKAVAMLRDAMKVLRRDSKRLGLGRFIAFVEPRIANDGRRWNLHAHAAFECRGHQIAGVNTRWRIATMGRGHFAIDRRVHLETPVAYARYITKASDWCPAPGDLSVRRLETLIAALRGRRLFIKWGFPRTRWWWVVRLRRAAGTPKRIEAPVQGAENAETPVAALEDTAAKSSPKVMRRVGPTKKKDVKERTGRRYSTRYPAYGSDKTSARPGGFHRKGGGATRTPAA